MGGLNKWVILSFTSKTCLRLRCITHRAVYNFTPRYIWIKFNASTANALTPTTCIQRLFSPKSSRWFPKADIPTRWTTANTNDSIPCTRRKFVQAWWYSADWTWHESEVQTRLTQVSSFCIAPSLRTVHANLLDQNNFDCAAVSYTARFYSAVSARVYGDRWRVHWLTPCCNFDWVGSVRRA